MTPGSVPAAAGLRWIVVVPVKGVLGAKTRLGDAFDERRRGALALAFARDTIAAALAADAVERVIVVTNAAELHDVAVATDVADAERVSVVAEGTPRGLNAAIAVGVGHAERWRPASAGIAVLLGDLPALRGAELSAALAVAAEHATATVPDAEGTGTTLLTARPGVRLHPAFGAGSAAAHREGGAVVLDLPQHSTLRHDVDTADALASAVALGVGPATSAVLARR